MGRQRTLNMGCGASSNKSLADPRNASKDNYKQRQLPVRSEGECDKDLQRKLKKIDPKGKEDAKNVLAIMSNKTEETVNTGLMFESWVQVKQLEKAGKGPL